MTRTLLVLLVAAMVAAGCSSTSTDTAATETTAAPATTAAPETTSAPTTVAEVDEPETVDEPIEDPDADLDVLEAELLAATEAWQATNGAPAVSLAVQLPNDEILTVAIGVTDLVDETPVDTDDYFRIASITKPMTAALTLQLIDEGLIGLDDPVRDYIPEWLDGYEYADDITIRQLMDHTNGLIEYALDASFFQFAGQRIDQAMEPEEIWAWLAEQEPLFAPGEEYSYETGGFLTLGTVIEGVTGNTAAEEMRARIFEPAGAENIYLTPQEFPPEPVVTGYGRDLMYFAGTTLIGRTDEIGLTINDEPVVGLYTLPQDVLQSAGWTGGGNEARPESVARIFSAMFDGTILSDELIAEMTNPLLASSNYGLGISVGDVDGTVTYTHGGGVPGFRSHAGYLPEHDVSYAFSTSLIPLPDGTDVGELEKVLVPLLLDHLG